MTWEQAMGKVGQLRRDLEDDWDSYGAIAPKFPADHYAVVLLTDLAVTDYESPAPWVFPLVEGGYQLEWEDGLEVRIYNDERVDFFWAGEHALEDSSFAIEYYSQDFDRYPAYSDMVKWILALLDRPNESVRDF